MRASALLLLLLPASASASASVANFTTEQQQRHRNGQAAFVTAPPQQSRPSSMKRAPSPPAAFTSSIKRSFGITTAAAASAASSAEKSTTQEGGSEAQKSDMMPPMHKFRRSLSHSWLTHLSPEDPLNYEKSVAYGGGPSRRTHPGRPVYNGHYVDVRPTPLKGPKLVVHSPELCEELGFGPDEAKSDAFVKYFSGDVDGAFAGDPDIETTDAKDEDDAGMSAEKAAEGVAERRRYVTGVQTWATPYALSIMGRRYTNNCPYGTGDGYGDGRAISVGEVLVPHGGGEGGGSVYPHSASRYELQLKGGGQTPFCRGADGRAVLRSSIREFLASEAMHHLGVSTTRALSLIVSEGGDTSARPWYSSGSKARELPSMDDPRLARYDIKQRREILSQLAAQAKSDPDMLVEEKCAITTRVAPSFVRIGHLDLFARRVEMLQMSDGDAETPIKETSRYQELEDMMWHGESSLEAREVAHYDASRLCVSFSCVW